MSRKRENSSSNLLLPVRDKIDARVDVLLFLGISFFCWLLWNAFHERLLVSAETPSSLRWDGQALQANKLGSGQGEDLSQTPAAVTPFLFQPIPINLADQELLETISGIGPGLAAQIIKTRESKGWFLSPQDLQAVPGIGPKRMQQFVAQFSFQTP
jgi:hypothetical protein